MDISAALGTYIDSLPAIAFDNIRSITFGQRRFIVNLQTNQTNEGTRETFNHGQRASFLAWKNQLVLIRLRCNV